MLRVSRGMLVGRWLWTPLILPKSMCNGYHYRLPSRVPLACLPAKTIKIMSDVLMFLKDFSVSSLDTWLSQLSHILYVIGQLSLVKVTCYITQIILIASSAETFNQMKSVIFLYRFRILVIMILYLYTHTTTRTSLQ